MNPLAVQDERGPRKKGTTFDLESEEMLMPPTFERETLDRMSYYKLYNIHSQPSAFLPLSIHTFWEHQAFNNSVVPLQEEKSDSLLEADKDSSLILPIQILVQILADLHTFSDQISIHLVWPKLFLIKASSEERINCVGLESQPNGFCTKIAKKIAELELEQCQINLIKLAILKRGLKNKNTSGDFHIEFEGTGESDLENKTNMIFSLVSSLNQVTEQDVTNEYFNGNSFLVNSFLYRHLKL